MRKAFLLAVSLAAAAAWAQSTADGQLTVGGQSTKLTNVYAYTAEGFFDKTKNDTIVLLTDRAVTPAQARDTRALERAAESGKLAFVQETINASGQIINFTVGHSAFKMPPSGGSTEHRFEGKQDKQAVAGKVYTRGEQSAFGGAKYQYTATFTSAVAPKK